MLWRNRHIISERQRGLLFDNQQFVRVLAPGVHRFRNWFKRYTIKIINLNETEAQVASDEVLYLAGLHPDQFADYLIHWQTAEHQVGLVYERDVLQDIKAPGQRGAYWKGNTELAIKLVDSEQQFSVPKQLARLLIQPKSQRLRESVAQAIVVSNIPDNHVGFLQVDGEQIEVLSSGLHVWWRFNRQITVRQIDCRLQNMEVNGQEILTRDRVSLRVNLSATWQIEDAQTVHDELTDAQDFLYRELQLALRTVVSTQTLDELLEDKNLLNQQIRELVTERATRYGISVKTVGARDIVLPGDMKLILAQVVEAQKMAEANLIRRREETQATRSLHNTAKVMEGNPTLLRLKELEVLEKITGQINTLNVYGGLDGVMNDMVKLTSQHKAG
ncbi:MAG: slipin family protein [Gammaproteobacteria bacterium]|nr:slipin family protein [Gammaproteobacteria bacterium]